MTIPVVKPSGRLLSDLDDADFARFEELCSQSTDPSLYPSATELSSQVVIFDTLSILPLLRSDDPTVRNGLMDEFQRALHTGPGVFVLRGMVPSDIIDRAEVAHEALNPKAKHGHASGSGSRRTFAFNEKHAMLHTESFGEYYANDALAAVCEAWLGPSYQITASTNATFKGGQQQDIHRDYHVSHQALDRIRRFPVLNQIASQFLTLQSAIAHTDMPLSTGPTRFMPFSQLFDKGYIAVRDPRFIEYVRSKMVQLPLNKGDAVFFNPATFHQPGVNESDNERVANLLQVSSAFGRSMESNDRLAMSKAVWPVIKKYHEGIKRGEGKMRQEQLEALIAATCSDYGYPKVVEMSEPGPETQAGIVKKALEDGTSDEEAYAALEKHQSWHKP